jgi:PAS domain S-box-containing protein
LTGLLDEELATEAIARGAQDYLVKGQFEQNLLRRSILYAIERKKSHQLIEDSEERFRTLADNISQLAWMADREGNVFWHNKRWFDYTGTTPEEMEGGGWQKVFHPEHASRAVKKMRESIEGGVAWEDTYPLRGKDGVYRWFLCRVVPIKDEKGNVLRWFGTKTDITQLREIQEELSKSRNELELRVRERTEELSRAYDTLQMEFEERKRIEEERQQLEEQLRQSQKMEAIGTLAGGIAHDFNNMLAVILGNAELMEDELDGNDLAKRKIDQIVKAAMRARELVTQILTFSRKAGRERKPLMLAPLLKDTYKLLRGSLPSTIEMKLDLETESVAVVADPSQIQQVVMNLSANAAQAMRKKGGLLTIGLSEMVFHAGDPMPDSEILPGSYITLTVKDTGSGMTPEVIKRIFEPFYTTKGPGEGTGMGLAVVYGIVKSHSGAVIAESTPGQGSCFTVFLPQIPAKASKEDIQDTEVPHGKERILFVDDEPSVTEASSHMLTTLGYKVTVAFSGFEAWELFRAGPDQFDLVITDQTMPDITGIALAEKMLKTRKDLPVVLCTGYSEAVSAETAKEAGIKDFLMKPLTKREMAQAIRRVLDQTGSSAEQR